MAHLSALRALKVNRRYERHDNIEAALASCIVQLEPILALDEGLGDAVVYFLRLFCEHPEAECGLGGGEDELLANLLGIFLPPGALRAAYLNCVYELFISLSERG